MYIAAKETNQKNFGLLLSSHQKSFPIGILWPLIANSLNLETALNIVSDHFHLHNQGLYWILEREGDHAVITRADRIRADIPSQQYTILSMCSCFRALKALCGSQWNPTSVSFIQATPKSSQPYDQFFGTKVTFNQEFNRITFPASYLSKKSIERNGNLHNQLHKQVQKMEDNINGKLGLYSKIKMLIKKNIHSSSCTNTNIADALSMHPKALQRELAKHHTNFRKLRSEVRLDMAERYLSESDISLTIITEILGFSELSNFSHAFKSRRHISPAAWRSKKNIEKGP